MGASEAANGQWQDWSTGNETVRPAFREKQPPKEVGPTFCLKFNIAIKTRQAGVRQQFICRQCNRDCEARDTQCVGLFRETRSYDQL